MVAAAAAEALAVVRDRAEPVKSMPLVMQLTESQAYTLAAHVWLKHSVEQDVPMARPSDVFDPSRS